MIHNGFERLHKSLNAQNRFFVILQMEFIIQIFIERSSLIIHE